MPDNNKMDFDSLISVAAGYSDKAKADAQVKRYTTDVKPAKKPPKSSVQSDAIKAFLRKKEVEEQKRRKEALQEKDKLLELRAAAKHNRRASNMARRTKDNDFGINFNRLLQEKQEKELADAVAAAVGANADSPIIERKRRRRRKLLSDETLEHDLGADRILTLKEENREVRNGTHSSGHRQSESSGYRVGRDSTSVSRSSSSSTPAPSRGVKRAAPPPPPDFFSLLKIAKTKQYEPIDIPVKKKVATEEERPMTKEERERYRDEKAYLAAKLARQNQNSKTKSSSPAQSASSHRPSAGGGFKIPKTKPTSSDPPPPSRNQNSHSEKKPRPSSSSKNPLVQQNIANQLGAKVTKFPSSFNNSRPSDVTKRKLHQEEMSPHRSSTVNGMSRTDTAKPTKSSFSGPPDAVRHSSSKDSGHTKGPTHSRPPSVSSKSDPSELFQAHKLWSKQAPPRPLTSSGSVNSGKTLKNSVSRPVIAKDSSQPAFAKAHADLTSRPSVSEGRNNLSSRPPDTKVRTDASGRSLTSSRVESSKSNNVQIKPKTAVKPSSVPSQTGRKEVPAKSQPLQEIRKSSQGQETRRPLSGQEVRKTPTGLDVRKAPPGQEIRKAPPGQEIRKAPPGQEIRKAPPGQPTRNVAPGQDVRRAVPGQDVRRVAAPSQEVRRVPPGQEMRKGPPSQEMRRGPPAQGVRRVPPGLDTRRPPPREEIRELPPSQELRRLPSGQFVRKSLPPSRLPPITRNPCKRRIESDEEDSEMEDFIDDGPADGPGEDVSKYIREIFGYDKRRFIDEADDDEAMETSFAQQMKEEARSTRLGLLEDLEDIRKEQEEKAKKMKKKS